MNLTEQQTHFLTHFPLYFIPPYIAIHLLNLSWLTDAIAFIESSLLASAGVENSLYGSFIDVGNILFEIVVDCSGLVMITLFLALVYSAKPFGKSSKDGKLGKDGKLDKGSKVSKQVQVKQKTSYAFLAFVPAIFLFNLIRLFFTLWTGVAFGPQVLSIVHFALWFIDAGFVFLLWSINAGVDLRKALKAVSH